MAKKEKQYICDNAHLMSEWDWEKNNKLGLSPSKLLLRSNKKAWWKCANGHSWLQTIDKKSSRNSNCPYCTNKRVLVGENDLQTLFPHLIKEWHPTKNGSLRPEEYVIGSAKKVWWKCSKCGQEWEASIRSRTQRQTGCPVCALKKRASTRIEKRILENGSITNELLLSEWNYEKNQDLLPEKFTSSSNKKVWWKCSVCEYEWQAKISLRQAGRGCPCCSNRTVVKGKNDLATTNPELAKEWHPTKNGTLTPFDVTRGSGKKVWWKCPKEHEYKTSVLHRGHGTNCPICNSGRQTSFFEQAIFFYIKKSYPDAINRYQNFLRHRMEIDIFIPSKHLAIECDGIFWHNKENSKKRENTKYQLCHEKGITLWRVREQGKNEKSGCPTLLTGNAVKYSEIKADRIFYWDSQKGNQGLNQVISQILDTISSNDRLWGKQINAFPFFDVNVDRDRFKIYENTNSLLGSSLEDLFPELANEWHYEKNENIKPHSVMAGSDLKVWWICSKCGHEWETSPSKRTGKDKTGCPICSRKEGAKKRSIKENN